MIFSRKFITYTKTRWAHHCCFNCGRNAKRERGRARYSKFYFRLDGYILDVICLKQIAGRCEKEKGAWVGEKWCLSFWHLSYRLCSPPKEVKLTSVHIPNWLVFVFCINGHVVLHCFIKWPLIQCGFLLLNCCLNDARNSQSISTNFHDGSHNENEGNLKVVIKFVAASSGFYELELEIEIFALEIKWWVEKIEWTVVRQRNCSSIKTL